MAAIIVVLVIAGCSKKPTEYEKTIPINYAPNSLTAYPDTDKVTVKWERNSEAEAQSGFDGYYVYCTSRSLTYYQGTTDSVVGLAQIPAESLQYFQVPGSPFKNIDSVVVTKDPLTNSNLTQGQKYCFYVRSMVDGQLSWAGNWAWSCPRPIGYGTIYAFTPPATISDTMGMGLYSGFQFKIDSTVTPYKLISTLHKIPTIKWRIKYSDYTYYYPDTLTARKTYSKHFVADTSLRTTDSLQADTFVCGYVEWDSLPITFKTVWKNNQDTSQGKAYDVLIRPKYGSGTFVKPLINYIDLELEKVPGNPSQVRLTCPLLVSNIPVSSAWAKGRETFIQPLPTGYNTAVPVPFNTTSYSVNLNLGETGNVYQLKTAGSNYAKIQIDSVVTSGNTIKVCFRYAYQMAAGIKNF